MSERIQLSAADFWELQALLYKVENARLVLNSIQAEALAKVKALGAEPDQPWKLDPQTKTLVVDATA